MTWLDELALALRFVWRDGRAGELGLLALAIVIAVASLTTVGFFTDRVQQALQRQSNQLLGGDLTIVSDRRFSVDLEQAATARGLLVARTTRFASMVLKADENMLADVKAVSPGYPLRGEVRIADQLFGPERPAGSVPPAGTAWVDERLLTRLGLKIGERIELGQAKLQVAALITHEPDSVIGFLNSLPRLIINEADIEATGLIQPGSRVRYRLYLAGDSRQIDEYREWARPRMRPGQNVEGIREARPEIRAALDRAERFLSLAALLSVVLAAVAVALAARRFLVRHLDACAVMRCLGAKQISIFRIYALHFLLLALVASVIGCAIGFGAQAVLASWLESAVRVELPAPSLRPVWYGIAAGVSLLFGFALPPLASLARVSTLRVLRRELGVPGGAGVFGYALGVGLICGLVLWKTHDPRLGLYVLGGFLGAAAVSAVLVFIVLRALAPLRAAGGVGLRYGLANLTRRPLAAIVQIVGLGVGIMALLTLTLVRGDLVQSWQATLRTDSPNRFIINIQSEQVPALRRFFTERGLGSPELFPMVRGRLVAINDREVSATDYVDERAKRLIDREFNLSSATDMQADNQLVAGRWWKAGDPIEQLSVEEGIAGALRLALGDRLTYDVAGNRFTATVTSLRKVDWDTFNVNFFVLSPPALLDRRPVTYITSFYAPQGQTATLNLLVREFPNIVLIDVAQVMAQVQKMMDQVSRAIQFVFLFTLAAGIAVLYAALASTRDEREHDAAIMRTLGASRRQLALAQLSEFAVLGALAGLLAAGGATGLGFALATRVLNVPYLGNAWIWPIGIVCGAVGVAIAGILNARRVLAVPPLQSLRRIA